MRYHWIDTKSCQYLVRSRRISTRSRWIWQDLIELVGGDRSSRLESDSDATVDQPTFRNLISGGCNPPSTITSLKLSGFRVGSVSLSRWVGQPYS